MPRYEDQFAIRLKEMRVQQGNEEMMKAAKQDLEMMKTIPLHGQIVQSHAAAENKGSVQISITTY